MNKKKNQVKAVAPVTAEQLEARIRKAILCEDALYEGYSDAKSIRESWISALPNVRAARKQAEIDRDWAKVRRMERREYNRIRESIGLGW
jgi:hypothetical protein